MIELTHPTPTPFTHAGTEAGRVINEGVVDAANATKGAINTLANSKCRNDILTQRELQEAL